MQNKTNSRTNSNNTNNVTLEESKTRDDNLEWLWTFLIIIGILFFIIVFIFFCFLDDDKNNRIKPSNNLKKEYDTKKENPVYDSDASIGSSLSTNSIQKCNNKSTTYEGVNGYNETQENTYHHLNRKQIIILEYT